MAGDWRDLRVRFLAALRRPQEEGEPWRALWEIFAAHPWYRRQLNATARRVTIRNGAPFDLAGDVAHEALLLLARELRRAPSLGVERLADEDGFLAWTRTIINRHCRESLRRLRRAHDREAEIAEEDRVFDPTANLEARLDLYDEVMRLPPRQRAVVQLYVEGWKLAQIATELNQPYRTVYSLWRRATQRIGGALAGDEPTPPHGFS